MRGIEARHLDIAQRHGLGRGIDDPHCGLLIDLGQRGRWNFDERVGVSFQCAGDGCAETHRFGRGVEPDLDTEGSRDGIGRGRDLAYTTDRLMPVSSVSARVISASPGADRST